MVGKMTTDNKDNADNANNMNNANNIDVKLAPLGLGFPPAVPEAGAIATFKRRFDDICPTWVYRSPTLQIYGPLPGADPRLPAGATWLAAPQTATLDIKEDQS